MSATTVLGKVTPTTRGAWNAAVQYEAIDIVSYNGGSWISKRPNIGIQPVEGDDWLQLAEAGSDADVTAENIAAALGYTPTSPTYVVAAVAEEASTRAAADTSLSARISAIEGKESGWDAKQDAISDLASIRSGAALGVTAVQPETGKGLSSNDYTNAEKSKLEGIEDGAEANVQSDWDQTDTSADDFIKNKPIIPEADTEAVHYTEDTGRAAAEKAQARTNIGAAAPDGYYGASGGTFQYATNFVGFLTPQNAHDVVFRPTASHFDANNWVAESISGDRAAIEKIKGKTLVFNQLVPDINENSYGITITTTNHKIVVSGKSTDIHNIWESDYEIINGHKYYINGFTAFADGSRCGFQLTSGRWIFLNDNTIQTGGQNYFSGHLRYRANEEGITPPAGNGHPIMIDLTQMYGAGNEPSTGEEFKAQFPLDYYAYNEGELISLNATGLKTVGFNQLYPDGHIDVLKGLTYKIEGTYTSLTDSAGNDVAVTNGEFTPTANDTYTMAGGSCVHLKWSGVRDGDTEEHWDSTLSLPIATYFPDGMKSAGTVYDELTKDKAIKRFGKVDLGTLDWTLRSANEFMATLPVLPLGDTEKAVVSNGYEAKKWYRYSMATTNVIFFATYGYTLVKDTNYSTASAFKTAMNGVMLYYELAEPVETPINPPLNLTYRCDDFGTEMLLPQNDDEPVTAPMDAGITYGTDYEATIRNLPVNYMNNSFIWGLIGAFKNVGYTMTARNKDGQWSITLAKDPEPEPEPEPEP